MCERNPKEVTIKHRLSRGSGEEDRNTRMDKLGKNVISIFGYKREDRELKRVTMKMFVQRIPRGLILFFKLICETHYILSYLYGVK